MLINPLDVKKNCEIEKNISNNDVVSDIISFLIKNHSNYLSDIEINKEMVENIVREKVYKEYSNMNTESTIKTILDRLFGYYILQKYIDNVGKAEYNCGRKQGGTLSWKELQKP